MRKWLFILLLPSLAYGQELVSAGPVEKLNTFKVQYFPSFNKANQKIYFTSRVKGIEHIFHFEEGKIILDFGNNYNEGTAIISADGKTMIYSECNSLKSYGSCDLVERKWENDQWSESKNLGAEINSTDWEGHPWLSEDGNTLIYSSSKYGSKGGKDIWIARKKDDFWTSSELMMEKINTKFDEIGPYFIERDSILLFSSNRPGGKGKQDFYQYDIRKQELRNWEELNSELDEAGILMKNWETGEGGIREFLYSKDLVGRDGIRTEIWQARFKFKELPNKEIRTEEKKFEFLVIQFEINSFEIKEISQNMVDLKEYLSQNPDINIEIIGHTDASGEKENNQILSEKRAESLKIWLEGQGISPTRVIVRGEGSNFPISDDPEKNRRIEIKFK
ncbi:MAG: hypothetical protein RIR51_1896 [Bacteroidota bacterium]|jgi:outer membrane protein OmpA-like peptidoglycan-associated protein